VKRRGYAPCAVALTRGGHPGGCPALGLEGRPDQDGGSGRLCGGRPKSIGFELSELAADAVVVVSRRVARRHASFAVRKTIDA
jgi:hypothetical protein